ncbi:hypothetical protein [Shinella pollutisoli]|uniref:Uncharacterized protein n=1 Tax=Shinella pollutisoli TaxID=2250594 RepID=A0ABV7DB11_9HYPH|nr:hypothetical protein [Shinella pollutisoli]
MSQPATSPAQIRLNAIRQRLANASPDWGLVADGRLVITAGEGDDQAPVLAFDLNADIGDQELMAHARDDIVWLLSTYEKLARRYHDAAAELQRRDGTPKRKNHSAECAMLCERQDFRRFLHDRHGLETTDAERVNARVRSILAIRSRADIDTDEDARKRWLSLRAEFNRWKEGR